MSKSWSSPAQIAAFYHFQTIPQSEVDSLSENLEEMGQRHGLKGLIIFATEGVNGTIAGPTQEAVVGYLAEASALLGFPSFAPKWSEAPVAPFKKFKVRVREEIVTLGKPEVQPLPPKSETHLSPAEWNKMMEQENCVVVDTRNWYETKIGKFKGAVDPKLSEFHQWGDYLKEAEIPKEQNVLIYCTGGIRCEKAIVEMHQQGFKNVFQLDGGILNYLEQFPNEKFEGECFVFDHRVAVDQNLQPSTQYKMCPHCGQPAEEVTACVRCDSDAIVCDACKAKGEHFKTCSKNCSYHYELAPGKKGRSQSQGYRFAAQNRQAPLSSISTKRK